MKSLAEIFKIMRTMDLSGFLEPTTLSKREMHKAYLGVQGTVLVGEMGKTRKSYHVDGEEIIVNELVYPAFDYRAVYRGVSPFLSIQSRYTLEGKLKKKSIKNHKSGKRRITEFNPPGKYWGRIVEEKD